MKKQLLILLILFIGTMNAFSQLRTVGTDSERNAEYKKAIGLDTTIPDFNTNMSKYVLGMVYCGAGE